MNIYVYAYTSESINFCTFSYVRSEGTRATYPPDRISRTLHLYIV